LTRNSVPDWEPAWSPDGKKIAWLGRGPHGTGADVFVMNADGSDQQNLTPKPGTRGEPRWAPDGRAILLTAVPPGQPPSASGWPYSDVYIMNVDGSRQRNLTHTPSWRRRRLLVARRATHRLHPGRSAGGAHDRRHERGRKRQACCDAPEHLYRRPGDNRGLVA
jgi:hypothetical protein